MRPWRSHRSHVRVQCWARCNTWRLSRWKVETRMHGPISLLSESSCMRWSPANGHSRLGVRASLIASILTTQPAAIRSLQPVFPVALARLIESCLAKDPEQRWQNVGDLERALSGISDGLSAAGLSPGPKRETRQALLLISAAVAVFLPIAVSFVRLGQPQSENGAGHRRL